MKITILFIFLVFTGIVLFRLSESSIERSDKVSLCRSESNVEGRTPLTVFPSIQSTNYPMEEGKYIARFKFQAYNEFDLFWYSSFIEPPIIGNNNKRVFKVGAEPQEFETSQSEQKSITIGKTAVSFVLFDSYFVDNKIAIPVKGKYPLIGESKVIQTIGKDSFFRRDTHFKKSGNDQAIDLEAPLGTDVTSFGAGRVVYVEDRYHDEYACGMEHTENYSNHVLVLQDDGYEALYGHLLRDSVVAKSKSWREAGADWLY